MTPGDTRLAGALRAEHAAIYGYDIVGAHLAGAHLAACVTAQNAHRARRDALMSLLAAKGVPVPGAETAYAMPFKVTDDATAVRLAGTIESRTAAFWLLALPDTTGDERRTALDALTDCATREVQWRQLAGEKPATVAFPGKG